MTKDEVNELTKEYILLEDEVYLGNVYKHKWRCLCGNIIVGRQWNNIKSYILIKCEKCKYDEIEQRYRRKIEKNGDYEYIRSFRSGDMLPNGNLVKVSPYIQIKHKYCGNIYEVQVNNFINRGQRCTKCCGSYENSFAHHIEQELKLDINDVWDFEKNKVSPYYISKGSDKETIGRVWIKCQEKDYHGSYEISCDNFLNGQKCGYCNSRIKVHPLDSFGQYLKDDGLLHLWSDKNTVDPFTISKSTGKKVWMLCDKHDYHNDYGGYLIQCYSFVNGIKCGYCNPRGKAPTAHIKDSFGYHHFDKVMNWHPDNNISPFRVAPNSNKKYKFICETCGYEWSSTLSNISNGKWCTQCKSSKGEKKISEWLRRNNIKYEIEKMFDRLVGLSGGNLRYDFYLPDYNLLIEYDGIQHYKWTKGMMTREDFKKLQHHDKLKNEYAKNNNIKLIRIPHSKFGNIENILKDYVFKS